MHISVFQESQYGSGPVKKSLKGNLLLSLNVLEKVPHNQLRVLLIPALLPSLGVNHQFLPAFCPTTPQVIPFLL